MTPRSSFDPYAVLQILPTADQVVVHAAFRALALRYHPDHDQTRRASEKMAELNRAYATLRDEQGRAAHDRSRRMTVSGMSMSGMSMSGMSMSAASGRPSAGHPPPAGAAQGSVLGFGRYAGWSLRDLAREDPDYLLWLSRHSSGIRYRTEIYAILRNVGVSPA